jgi:glycolate oxidase iron-sulfur subunit
MAKPFKGLIGMLPYVGTRLKAMVDLAPARVPARSPFDKPGTFEADGPRRARVAILSGCAQPVLRPGFNEAAIRLLNRHGVEVVQPKGEGAAARSSTTWGATSRAMPSPSATSTPGSPEMDGEGLDAIIITASGCGTTIKDYGFMFRDDPAYAGKAKRGLRRSPRTSRNTRLTSSSWSPCARPTSWSPTTPPARCSTASRSARSPRRC